MDILCRNLSGAITAVVIIAVVARSADATEVKLHERVVPKASVVRLGDIADIMAKDQQLAKRLAAVPLMPAPAPETEQFVRQREVADMLAANGVELGSIRFSGAKQVAVSAASNVQTVTFQERASAEIDAPTNRHAVILAGGKVVVAPAKPASISKEFTKPQLCRVVRDYLKVKSSITEIGKIDCNVTSGQLAQLADATSTPVCSGGSEPWTGRQRLTLSFATAAGPAQLTVYADVAEAALPMVVALRPVARGDVITAADIELRRLEPSAKTSGLRAHFDSIEELIGMESRQALQQGEIVFADQVQPPVLVKRGDLISVGSQSGGIRVRTTAKAMQDGVKGDLIQVESLSSKQRYDARVMGIREAAVFAPLRVSASQQAARTKAVRR